MIQADRRHREIDSVKKGLTALNGFWTHKAKETETETTRPWYTEESYKVIIELIKAN